MKERWRERLKENSIEKRKKSERTKDIKEKRINRDYCCWLGHSRPPYFNLSIQLTVNGQYKFCQWVDSNRGPLDSNATALPTETHHGPFSQRLMVNFQRYQIWQNFESLGQLLMSLFIIRKNIPFGKLSGLKMAKY